LLTLHFSHDWAFTIILVYRSLRRTTSRIGSNELG
jgi:hypothetical protein